jgi:hypothetical protein
MLPFALLRSLSLTFVPIELFLQVRLSVGSPRQSTHGNLELPSATQIACPVLFGTLQPRAEVRHPLLESG